MTDDDYDYSQEPLCFIQDGSLPVLAKLLLQMTMRSCLEFNRNDRNKKKEDKQNAR